MSDLYRTEGGKFIRRYESETLLIEPWGENSLRVRASRMGDPPQGDAWALTESPVDKGFSVEEREGVAVVRHGGLTAVVDAFGKLTFYNADGKILLEEYVRTRRDLFSKDCSALEVEAREFKAIIGGDYTLTARFAANPEEKLYGMGQYQQPFLNLKGCMLELAQRNSQASVPFLLSSLGYGLLWNNPAIGSVTFGKNVTQWTAASTKRLDYWITAGDTPAQIEEAYASVTGKAPMMPECGLGFWQCKLRYQTQEELLEVAREYHRRGIQLDVIVVDYFHWPKQGDWCFDPTYWPDPDAMIAELRQMGIELMVSIWPTVEKDSKHYEEMRSKGYLIRSERGMQTSLDCVAPTLFADMTNPSTRKFVWQSAKESYYSKGVKLYWLDVAEPEYGSYDFDNYRYHTGSNLQVGNSYPLLYAKAFFDGLKAEGEQNIVSLLRCAWAGSQKYGALVWSGDIHSSFESMRNQLAAGLNVGMAGIPWWTTDIGGFHGGDGGDPAFRELFVRWFQWGTFCPVMRLHGDREPKQPKLGSTGGCDCLSGAANEIWSFGDEVCRICEKYIALREKLRPYVRTLMRQAHEKGTPVMRAMFYGYPGDPVCWETESQYLFGPDIIVSPTLRHGERTGRTYLPAGSWIEYETGKRHTGEQWAEVEAPLESIPFFVLEGSLAAQVLEL